MVSCPRLEPYTNFPLGETSTCAVDLPFMSVPGGCVGSACGSESTPVAASYLKLLMVQSSSLITYANLPLGWKARWRGPAFFSLGALGGVLGFTAPVSASKRYCAT